MNTFNITVELKLLQVNHKKYYKIIIKNKVNLITFNPFGTAI